MKLADMPLDDPEDTEHGAAERAGAASRSTWVSVVVNVVLTTVQIAVGVVAHSQALIADGIHSLSDLVADFVVLLASHHSRKDADEDHPYGHHKAEYFSSGFEGVLILAAALAIDVILMDLVMPVISLAVGKINLSDRFFTLSGGSASSGQALRTPPRR